MSGGDTVAYVSQRSVSDVGMDMSREEPYSVFLTGATDSFLTASPNGYPSFRDCSGGIT